MNDIKNKIRESLIRPIAENTSSTTITGTVTDADEIACICTVKYNNTKGITEEKSGIPIMNYNKNIIDWFPKKGELVVIQLKDEKATILGPADSTASLRQKMKLENDIYTDSFFDGMGGYIF